MRKVLLLCLAICFVFAMTALAFDDMGKSTTVKGWVADDKCGAKGANAKAEACTRKCLDAPDTSADCPMFAGRTPRTLRTPSFVQSSGGSATVISRVA